MTSPLLHADCKRAVSGLTNMSNDDLDSIINDDEKIENILLGLDHSYLQEIEEEKESLMAKNTELAEENLNREPELVEGREKLQELTTAAEELSKTVEEKTKDLRNKTGDMSLETSLALLQTAASEMEEESEACAKKFLANDVELDDFIDDFLTKRKIMHMRLVKAEKLAKILSRDPSVSGNYINAPPVNINSNYFPGVPNAGSVPYPVGNIGMPMPGMNFFQNHY